MTEEGATTAADDFRDRRQAGSRCDLVISYKLLPADLHQLSLTLHVEDFQSFDVSGKEESRFLPHIIGLTGQEPGRYGFLY